MFADDTGIISPRDVFLDLLENCTMEDGTDVGCKISTLFQVLNTPENERFRTLEDDYRSFPYVSGDLFVDALPIAAFDTKMRAFQERLSKLNFIDPACGCGNFLIIAYRELRLLEIDILKAIRLLDNKGAQAALDQSFLSRIDVDQFYGIEIEDFPHRIAQISLWMMDHIMNNRLSMELSESYVRIPLEKAPTIIHADALEIDRSDMLDPAQCSYVLGTPPLFVGSKMQSAVQRRQLKRLVGSSNSLDYVAAWFFKAASYMPATASIGFVATSSLTQGQQVAQIWPALLNTHDLKISFAHSAFKWDSYARGEARVHVVIVGLTKKSAKGMSRMHSQEVDGSAPDVVTCQAISPYLIDASGLRNANLVVRENKSGSSSSLPQLAIGSMPIDGGYYIFDASQRICLLRNEPGTRKFLRQFKGVDEFLKGTKRWILALQDAQPDELRKLPEVRKRIAAVRRFRAASNSAPYALACKYAKMLSR